MVLALPEFLAGCGGGGGGKTTAHPAIKAGVVVLPSDGSVTIVAQTDSTLVLKGAIPPLKAGSVVVSGASNGFIIKVISATTNGSDTTLQTVQATLEDVFSSADILLQKTLTASDFAETTPILSGVTITPPIDANALQAHASLSAFNVNFGDVAISGDISVNGDATIRFNVNDSINIDSSGVQSVIFVPSVTITGDLIITGTITVEDSKKVRYLHLVGTPQVIFIDLVPVVFVPVFDFYFAYDAKLTGSASFKAIFSTTLGAGVQYERESGWHAVTPAPDTSVDFVPINTFQAGITLTPLHVEYSELIMGIVGPTLVLDAPTIDSEITINPPSQPIPGEEIAVSATFDAKVGYTVQVLGKTLANSTVPGSISGTIQIFDEFLPDSMITVNSRPAALTTPKGKR